MYSINLVDLSKLFIFITLCYRYRYTIIEWLYKSIGPITTHNLKLRAKPVTVTYVHPLNPFSPTFIVFNPLLPLLPFDLFVYLLGLFIPITDITTG